MSLDADPAERWRARLRWFLYGDVSLAWLRPRRELLPSVMACTLLTLAVLHAPVGRHNDCVTPSGCRRLLARMIEEEPLVLAGALGLHVGMAVVVYVVGAGVTGLAARRVDLAEVTPWLFAPDDRTLKAVAVVGLAALQAYVAGAYAMAYSIVGLAVLYVLFFPPAVILAGVLEAPLPSGPLEALLAVVLLVALPVAEVLWLYALAHGAVAAVRTGAESTD